MQMDLKESALYEARYRFKERRSNVRFFILLLALAFLFLGLRTYWVSNFGGVVVDGSSMRKTLAHGQELVMQYAESRDAKRGDVIVVHVENYPEVQKDNEGKAEGEKLKYIIKRLIAVEGDTLYCEKGQIYIQYAGTDSFQPLEEPYAYYNPARGGKEGYNFAKYTVGEGEIFFLGDNRHNSTDSRYQETNANGEHSYSHLNDRLYKKTDIFGVVPSWAIRNQALLSKIFF